jgi:hypothetical protein
VGDLTLAYETVDLTAEPGLSMTIYAAEPGSSTEQALALLASWAAPRASKPQPSRGEATELVHAMPGARTPFHLVPPGPTRPRSRLTCTTECARVVASCTSHRPGVSRSRHPGKSLPAPA